jgi:hypothetical protein
MPVSPLPEGAFVWTNFPFGPPDRPDLPGPARHIAYVLGAREAGRGVQMLLAYTSSGAWRGAAVTPPLGVVSFTADEARALNQRAFHLELRCLARVPPTAAWFPEIDTPTKGIVAIASARLQARILGAAIDLAARRAELIEIRGPR